MEFIIGRQYKTRNGERAMIFSKGTYMTGIVSDRDAACSVVRTWYLDGRHDRDYACEFDITAMWEDEPTKETVDIIDVSTKMLMKPCPSCGNNNKSIMIYGYNHAGLGRTNHWFKCGKCGFTTRDQDSKELAAIAWNRLTPEPATSVIRWNRYNGNPKTLPEEVALVLLYRGPFRYLTFGAWREGSFIWDAPTKKNVEIGDLWAYLPTPEGL